MDGYISIAIRAEDLFFAIERVLAIPEIAQKKRELPLLAH
jgi:hypothetical protein